MLLQQPAQLIDFIGARISQVELFRGIGSEVEQPHRIRPRRHLQFPVAVAYHTVMAALPKQGLPLPVLIATGSGQGQHIDTVDDAIVR